jgi:hypothetical protein
MHSEHTKEPLREQDYTGKDVLYREGAVGLFDVQRAADALLRQGIKPSVAAIRSHIGGGSPNTITPLLAKYWQKLGERLAEGPESLARVPEALARVTELMWRRALEEARERLKILQTPDHKPGGLEEMQTQIGKLSVALAEARAREGEQLLQLSMLSREREENRSEKTTLLALVKAAQTLAEKHSARIAATESKSPLISTRKLKAARQIAAHFKKRIPARLRKARPTSILKSRRNSLKRTQR